MIPVEVRLRDGSTATLRRTRLDDAEGMWHLVRALVEDGRGQVTLPEEVADSPEPVREQLRWWVDHPESLHVVAEADGAVVGTVDVRRFARLRIQHVGTLSMGVHPAWQGRGLGRALLETALAWARAVEVERVELNVLADNDRARSLYASVGFVVTHRRERFVRNLDGTWSADLGMAWTEQKKR